MLHGLAGILTHIGDDAVAVVQALLRSQLCDHCKDMAQQCAVLFGQRAAAETMCFLGTTRKCTLAWGLMS